MNLHTLRLVGFDHTAQFVLDEHADPTVPDVRLEA